MEGNTPYNLALLAKRSECAQLLRSSEDDVLELPKELADQIKATQQKERAARITAKEKQKEQLKVLRIKNQYVPKHLDLFDIVCTKCKVTHVLGFNSLEIGPEIFSSTTRWL